MNTFRNVWRKLTASKRYRAQYVEAQAKRGIPFQIRELMKQEGLTQEQLAERSGLTQGVISRAASATYGNLTLNTIVRIAAGFDVAFIGRFVPFSELARWYDDPAHASSYVAPFHKEQERMDKLENALSADTNENRQRMAKAKTNKQAEVVKDDPLNAKISLVR